MHALDLCSAWRYVYSMKLKTLGRYFLILATLTSSLVVFESSAVAACNTTSKTDSYGRTTTTGKVGNGQVSTTSKTDSYGRTTTTGTNGSTRVNCTTRTDSYGRTTKSCPWLINILTPAEEIMPLSLAVTPTLVYLKCLPSTHSELLGWWQGFRFHRSKGLGQIGVRRCNHLQEKI